jgi:hypothetical protein
MLMLHRGWTSQSDSTESNRTTSYISATGGTLLVVEIIKYILLQQFGSFSVSFAGNPAGSTTVDYLVVAGGGGGGATDQHQGVLVEVEQVVIESFYVHRIQLPVSIQVYPIYNRCGGR